MRLRSRKAADYDDPATWRFAEMGNGGAENVEGSGQVQIPHLVPGRVVCLFHLRPSGEPSEHMHQHVELPGSCHDRFDGLTNGGGLREIDGQRKEVGRWKVFFRNMP